jgi:hypothetical protein
VTSEAVETGNYATAFRYIGLIRIPTQGLALEPWGGVTSLADKLPTVMLLDLIIEQGYGCKSNGFE